MPDDEEAMMADTPRPRVRAILRAIGRAWMAVHAPYLPPPSPADVAQATRVTWGAYPMPDGGYEWRAKCGCIQEDGHAPSMDSAAAVAQAKAMRLRRYAVQ